MGDQFPVQGLASHHVTIAGEQAILACTLFRNKLLILLTHTGRVASWIEAKGDKGEGGESTYSVTIRIGNREDTLASLMGRRLAQTLTEMGIGTELLIGFGLRAPKGKEKEMLDDAARLVALHSAPYKKAAPPQPVII